jgi:hypothetical protein
MADEHKAEKHVAGNHEIDRPIDLSDPSQRHENRDINVWAIGKVGIGLIVTTIVSIFFVLGVFRFLQAQYNANAPIPPLSWTQMDVRKLPPQPRLLQNEPENLKNVHASEDQILNGYTWVDQQHTQVRIPISQAIDRVLQKGLPARSQAPASAGVTVPTDASLGPKMQSPGGPLTNELAAPAKDGEQAK